MFRLLARRLSASAASIVERRLEDGSILRGILNPQAPQQLLEGVVQLPDGRAYRGKFDSSGGFPLPGCRLEDEGDVYEGEFNARWQREGRGRAWLVDGTCYEGRFEADDFVEGRVTIPQGTSEITFEGTLKDELFVRGRLSSADYVYEGEFHNNEPDGKGKLTFSSGAEQEGTFRGGKLHGSECKMKLEGGFVYVGEFVDGKIRYGTLFTPTYRYEGEFNESGRAHGAGSQTYLIHEPRLIFTGLWDNGAMTRGSVVDECGCPVEWKNDLQMQAMVCGDGNTTVGEERVHLNNYCSAKLMEADQMHRAMQKSYAEDAANVARETGKYPDKMDLRYEGGIREEQANSQRSAQKQMQDIERCKESSRRAAEELTGACSSCPAAADTPARKEEEKDAASSIPLPSQSPAGGVLDGVLNSNVARLNFSREFTAQELSAHRAEEQLHRFLRTFKDRKSTTLLDEDEDEDKEEDGTRPATCSECSGNVTERAKLRIEGNEPWMSFTPKGVQ